LESATAVGSDQVAAIPDGVWVSDPIPAAVVKSMIDKTKLSAGEKQRALTEDFGWTASRKQLLETLTLDHGQWTESASWDGEPFSVGANGPYAFPDDHTIAMQDNVSLITYAVSGNAASVRLKMVSDSASPNDLANDVEPVIVFCTAAWHRKA
jgi:hypothetical protein